MLGVGRSRKVTSQNSGMMENVLERRVKRGRPPKIVKNVLSVGGNEIAQVVLAGVERTTNKVMPELEAYRLDCSHSNVSPDSGIQSVPGSPVNENIHKSPNRDATPPVLRPVSPVKGMADKLYYHTKKIDKIKKRPGRPKKAKNNEIRNVLDPRKNKKLETQETKSEDRPPIHSLIPGKRGPGRPKKAPPILEPNIPPMSRRSDLFKGETNLNLMLNEICERVNRRLELPSIARGPVRNVELNKDEIERIITDHKSGKNRNSKFDTMFSKSKRLSNLPNVAIVKPMQHHLLNEKFEDDEKLGRRLGRRRKNSQDEIKWKDVDIASQKLGSELKENDMSDKKTKDFVDDKLKQQLNKSKRRVERGKKVESSNEKPIGPSAVCRSWSSLGMVTLGGDENKDYSKNKKPDIIKKSLSIKKSKKNEKKNLKAQKIEKSLEKPVLNTTVNPPSCLYPVHRKHTKFSSLRHGLLHHRHKKRKKNKKHKRCDKKPVDKEWFLKEIEKLIIEFQKCTIAVAKKSLNATTGGNIQSVVQGISPIPSEITVPSDFR